MNRKRWIGTLVAVHLLAGVFLTPGYIVPDSVATFSWLRSLVLQGDLLFFDEWAGFGMIRDGIPLFKEVTARGTLANHWWVGTSILSLPFYLVAHLIARVGGGAADGFTGLYAFTLAWEAVLFGAIASAAGFVVALKQGVSERLAAAAVAAVWLGTPMFWYEYRFPLGTHLAGILIVGLLVLVLARAGESEGRGVDVLAGLLLGLAVATRLQHFVLAPAVGLHLWRSGRRATGVAVAAGCSLLAFLPQALAWTAVYGHPLGPLVSGASPLGGTWMPFRSNALDEVVLSSYHGLLPWAPLAALAVVGWILEVRRRPLAATLLLMFVGEWIANGLFDRYFWGGTSFGPRRFVDLAVPLMVGTAWFLARTRRSGAVAAGIATGWTVLLGLAAAAGTLDLRGDVLPRELAGSIASIDWSALPAMLVGQSMLVRAPGGSLLGLAIVLAVGGAIVAAIRSHRAAIAALAAALAISSIAVVAAIPKTWSGAPAELRRFGIVLPAAREAGPLLDARGLLRDERDFLLNRGREREAAGTERLIEGIEKRLAELGVPDQ